MGRLLDQWEIATNCAKYEMDPEGSCSYVGQVYRYPIPRILRILSVPSA
jgi:hypothetical protein